MSYIKSVLIRKVNSVENLTIDIPLLRNNTPAHLVLTGPNGSGKSSILRMISQQINGISERSVKSLKEIEDEIGQLKDQIKVNLDAKESVKSSRTSSDPKRLERQIQGFDKYIKNARLRLDVLEHFPAILDVTEESIIVQRKKREGNWVGAFLKANRDLALNIAESATIRPQGHPVPTESDFARKLLQLLVNFKVRAALALERGDDDVRAEYTDWLQRFEETIRSILEDPGVQLVFDDEKFNFTIIKSSGYQHSFTEFSDGHKAIIRILGEIIMRIYYPNTNDRTPQVQPEGVVLIDEIETHLHLSLQEKILPLLTNLYPNIQFVVSTHSPAVLASISDAYVFDLESRIGIMSSEYAGEKYGTIMKGHFSVSDISIEVDRMLSRFIDLYNATELSPQDLQERTRLSEHLSSLSPMLQTIVWAYESGIGDLND